MFIALDMDFDAVKLAFICRKKKKTKIECVAVQICPSLGEKKTQVLKFSEHENEKHN